MSLSNNITITESKSPLKTVGDPCAAYNSMKDAWGRARAVLAGEKATKDYDTVVNPSKNLLLPFSPYMAHDQYLFYKSEAELPGLVAQYAKVLVGGLLRKQPQFKVPESLAGAKEWLESSFGADGSSMVSVLDSSIWEELNTTRAWLVVDHPAVTVEEFDALTPEERKELTPYCVVYQGEQVINWRRGKSKNSGRQVLTKFTVRMYTEVYRPGEHHPDLVDTVYDYTLDDSGFVVIQKYVRETNESVKVIAGSVKPNTDSNVTNAAWIPEGAPQLPMMHGRRLNAIPAFPLNGSIEVQPQILGPLIDREIGLYNKISRRNHLLYGAATYTPVVSSDMSDTQFKDIVNGGLGTWIHVAKGEGVTALETPTAALADMEKSIASTIEEMARMGIRMLSPDSSGNDSGVALEIRNSAQTAQLGLFNTKVSRTLEKVIQLMLEWKYDVIVPLAEIDFNMSQDFNPVPIGADWMRLVTEWYQSGIIPRSVFLSIAKQNDVVPADYDDDEGKTEIQTDPLVNLQPTVIDSSIR